MELITRRPGLLVTSFALALSLCAVSPAAAGPGPGGSTRPRRAIEFSPLSPLIRIYVVQVGQRLTDRDELLLGAAYTNIAYDIRRSHAPGAILGYRRYLGERPTSSTSSGLLQLVHLDRRPDDLRGRRAVERVPGRVHGRLPRGGCALPALARVPDRVRAPRREQARELPTRGAEGTGVRHTHVLPGLAVLSSPGAYSSSGSGSGASRSSARAMDTLQRPVPAAGPMGQAYESRRAVPGGKSSGLS